MKAVLISIRPHWCELIASGKKTIEVRKTRPKIEAPFKCYIYCTQPKYPHEDFITIGAGTENARAFYGGGKVIGEFVCDELMSGRNLGEGEFSLPWGEDEDCLSDAEIEAYGKNASNLYGWHISDLVIYDKPKELSEFMRDVTLCHRGLARYDCVGCFDCEITPPQSWRYVEELT